MKLLLLGRYAAVVTSAAHYATFDTNIDTYMVTLITSRPHGMILSFSFVYKDINKSTTTTATK